MKHFDPEYQYINQYINDSPIDLSGREGAPRAWTCDDCGADVKADEEHECSEGVKEHE